MERPEESEMESRDDGAESASESPPAPGDPALSGQAAGEGAARAERESSPAEDAAADPASASRDDETSEERRSLSSLDEISFPPGWEPGAPIPADYVDEALADSDALLGRRTDFSVPLLVGLVALFAIWLAAQYTLELRYAFSSSEALVLGPAEELQLDPERMRPEGLVLPSNRYAHIEAILERRAQSDDNAFYKVVGAPIIVHRIERDDTPRILRSAPRIPTRSGEQDVQPMYVGTGRLVAFEDLSDRYRSIAAYYSQLLGVEYCSVEPSIQLQRFLENRRERIRLRLEEELGRPATADELQSRLGRLARCERGYMFFTEQSPGSMWYFPALYLIFLAMLIGCGLVLWRWLRTTLRRD